MIKKMSVFFRAQRGPAVEAESRGLSFGVISGVAILYQSTCHQETLNPG